MYIESNELIRKTVVDEFERQVEFTPQAIALVNNENKITYLELNSRTNRLAALLTARYGIKKGDIVAVLMNKCELSYISMLAILKCGASYLPISVQTQSRSRAHEYLYQDLPALGPRAQIHRPSGLSFPQLDDFRQRFPRNHRFSGCRHWPNHLRSGVIITRLLYSLAGTTR